MGKNDEKMTISMNDDDKWQWRISSLIMIDDDDDDAKHHWNSDDVQMMILGVIVNHSAPCCKALVKSWISILTQALNNQTNFNKRLSS